MDNPLDKLEQIFKNLEADREKALAEFESIKTEAEMVDPRYRHKAREIGGVLLKIAIDASIGMAKIIEPMTKASQDTSGVGFSKKDLLEALETIDKKDKFEEISTEPLTSDEVKDAIIDEVIDKKKLLEELEQYIDASEAPINEET